MFRQELDKITFFNFIHVFYKRCSGLKRFKSWIFFCGLIHKKRKRR